MLAEKHSERLTDLKEKVTSAHQYFKKNAERYNEFMRFVFQSSLTNEDITKLQALNKPTIEFNIIEAIISRLRGDFAQQEPAITVMSAPNTPIESMTPEFIQLMEVLEGHMREIMSSSSTDNLQYNIYTDTLGGGYSVAEVYTDYMNSMTFDQKINVKRVFDPTLTGFDPLARESHKGDGQYCFQFFPRTEDEFTKEFGKEALEDVKFSRIDGFNWSYQNQDTNVVLVCDFYEKNKKKVKIVKISTGHVVTKKHFDDLLEMWEARGFIEQPPIIMEERWSEIEKIVRYRFCETRVLSYDETDYSFLPLVFIDGNSVEVKDAGNNSATQMTRPYAYHAKGIQKLKNFSGQTVAAEIENMVQHKFKVCIEAIPEDYLEQYRNVQQADVLMYNAFYESDPNVPLPPPMEIQRTMTPPIVESTFLGSDRVTQAILGSYDGVLGTNDQNVSGIAIREGAIHTSAAAIPYLVGYIKGLDRIATIILDLIPKYYVTPRTLPIKTIEGKRDYKIINHKDNPESIEINYNPHDLQVKVEAGVNTSIQKQVALDQIIRMMQASPLFAEFINSQGLETILDNMDIRGIDAMKAKAGEFMQQLQEQQQQQAQQTDPMQEATQMMGQVEMAKIEQRKEQAEGDLAIQSAKLAIEKQKVDAQVMQILNDIEMGDEKLILEQEKVDSENARSAVETAISLAKSHGESMEKEMGENE